MTRGVSGALDALPLSAEEQVQRETLQQVQQLQAQQEQRAQQQ